MAKTATIGKTGEVTSRNSRMAAAVGENRMDRAGKLKRVLFGMREALRSCASAAPDDTITVGDFRIDFTKRTAALRDRPLPLTDEEFELLIFLIDHPKKLVTQQTKLATSWAGQGLRQAEFLRVLLSLRKKLDGESPAQHYIRTEPWVFYRFDPNASQ